MYYRRKILLSLLDLFDGELEKIRLQKLLMLYCNFQEKPSFDFIPYKFGCFSFQANADLNTMIKYKQIEEKQNVWKKTDAVNYLSIIKKKDLEAFSNLKRFFGNKTSKELIKLTYQKYPYYAINSTILNSVLNKDEIYKIEAIKLKKETECKLFTIGYEGVSLEKYLNKLLKNGIKALIDVRKNPLSMKYGFSKKQLSNSCNGVNIKYYHFPELGIESSKRKELNCQKDYDDLFDEYKEINLKNTIKNQSEVIAVLKKHNRIALTCFEANVCQCHRKPLAESISNLPEFTFSITHI